MISVPPGELTTRTAAMLTSFLSEMERKMGSTPSAPVTSFQGTYFVGDVPDDAVLNTPFYGKLSSGPDSNLFYSWDQALPRWTGTAVAWDVMEGGKSGTLTIAPAKEANGIACQSGDVVQFRRLTFDATYDWIYVFEAPARTSSGTMSGMTLSNSTLTGTTTYAGGTANYNTTAQNVTGGSVSYSGGTLNLITMTVNATNPTFTSSGGTFTLSVPIINITGGSFAYNGVSINYNCTSTQLQCHVTSPSTFTSIIEPMPVKLTTGLTTASAPASTYPLLYNAIDGTIQGAGTDGTFSVIKGSVTLTATGGGGTATGVTTIQVNGTRGALITQPSAGVGLISWAFADGTSTPGLVSTIAQTFAGAKTFSDGFIAGNPGDGVLHTDIGDPYITDPSGNAAFLFGTGAFGSFIMYPPGGATGGYMALTPLQSGGLVYLNLVASPGPNKAGYAVDSTIGASGTDAIGNVFKRGIITTVDSGSHIVSSGSTPSISGGTGAGTAPTVSISGNDTAGVVSVTPGVAPATGSQVAKISFAVAFASAPRVVVLAPANAATALLSGTNMVFADPTLNTTSDWQITSGTVALIAATVYKWQYIVIG